jgi:FKBP-type peptidyl-prolyl cis-trans isomerase
LKKPIIAIAVLAAAAGCASPDSKPLVTTKATCDPAPTQLVVKDIKEGSGRAVKFRSAVAVGYTGWLYDGCKSDLKGVMFDTSAGRATPFGFMVGAGRVIKGWDEGLIGMREKGKRMLIIPADKAYGDRAAGDKIPPNSTLVFEIDLDQIVYQPPEG